MTTHIIHHANCPDGVVAYLIAAEAAGPDHVRHPISYGDDLPAGMKEGDDIVIVDFCPPVEQLGYIIDGAASLTILDHHATARDILHQFIERPLTAGEQFIGAMNDCQVVILLDQERSGAGIAWDYYNCGHPMPDLVAYTQDKDLWRHELPESRRVGTLLNALPKGDNLNDWAALMHSNAEHLIEASRFPFMLHEQAIEEAVARSWWVEAPNGEVVPVTVCEYRYGSSVAEALTQANEVPMAMYFTPSKPGDPIGCGVRGPGSRRFAELWGGGGHDNAAGFKLGSWEGWEHQ